MRKIMMVALFSVLSLSACAVEDPTQTDDPAVEEIDGSKLDSMEPVQPAEPTEMVEAHDLDRMSELPAVLEATQCDDHSDCYSNVCDLEKHLCRQFPF
jgi:hypothetical protein